MNPSRTSSPLGIRFNKSIIRLSYLRWTWMGICILYVMSIYPHLDGGHLGHESALSTTHTIDTWNALKSEKDPFRIQSIHILGERNSGTTWMYEHLGVCFNHSIPVRRRLKRYKHWFQEESLPSETFHGALVLAMFRNPFEWVEAMRRKPHHAPNHLNLTWQEFVTRPWTMDRVFLDLNVTLEQKQNVHFCQEHFPYDDVISCHPRPYPTGYFPKTRFSQHQPLYEMRNDASGQPFASILQLRAAKIYNFLSTQKYDIVKDHWIVRYEEVLQEGTGPLIQRLEQVTGVQAECKPSPPQNRRRRELDPDMIQYVTSHLDWEAEHLVGYYPTVQG